ncbi:sulfur reduction protein DsrJ [uncultured Thiodictyon sp.]|uniref:sulfur reduction protein DsrJ n=1 Tax=uncultured Thiodictyon sp. TaxID=1846217 RepID=UPI0025E0C061|nr:sulfur reduction protein DsrJ [uncultured Thiodictyon sp.]
MVSGLIPTRAGLILLGLCCALVAQCVLAGDGQCYVRPGSRAAALDDCVAPTAFMRRNHMELIKHQRDATVHQGIRGTRDSLAGCIDCHVSRAADGQPVAVNEKHQFCSACHAFAAVKVDCFDCHAAVPRGAPLSEAAGGMPENDLRRTNQ